MGTRIGAHSYRETRGCTHTCIPTQLGTRLCHAGTLCNREGVWWECGVAGEMGSFLNCPSAALHDGRGGAGGRPQLLPRDSQGCLPLHVGQDVHLDVADRGPVVPAHDGYTVWPHQELLKVPADVMDLHGIPEEAVR